MEVTLPKRKRNEVNWNRTLIYLKCIYQHLTCLWTWITWNYFIHENSGGNIEFWSLKDITNANPYPSDICHQSSIELEVKWPNFNVHVQWQFNDINGNQDLHCELRLHLQMKWNELIWAQYAKKRSMTIFDTHFVWCYFILWFSTSIRNNFLLETCSGPLSTSDTLTPQIYAPGLDGRHPRPVEKRPFCVIYLPLTSFCTQTLILTSLTL